MNEFESERGHKPLRHGDGLWVRYGGLSPLAQEKFVRDPEQRTFHSPPCRRGIFAFPSGYVERFLLGATCAPGHVSHKTRWLRDETGEKLEYAKHMTLSRDSKGRLEEVPSPELRRLMKRLGVRIRDIGEVGGFVTALKQPRVFRYTGELWHHLSTFVPEGQVLAASGSWVKTTYEVWQEALSAAKHDARRSMHKTNWGALRAQDSLAMDPFKRYFSRDELEVFIERLR